MLDLVLTFLNYQFSQNKCIPTSLFGCDAALNGK